MLSSLPVIQAAWFCALAVLAVRATIMLPAMDATLPQQLWRERDAALLRRPVHWVATMAVYFGKVNPSKIGPCAALGLLWDELR